MKKEVLVTIVGLHDSETDNDRVDTVCEGTYGKIGETHVITYEESDEEGMLYRTTMRLRDDYLEVTKKGTITSKLVYELGKETVTEYVTPYGALSLEFNTKLIEIMDEDEKICAHVEYAMGICGAHHADCRIDIKIENKQ